MYEKKVFVQYSNNINDVIKQPLQLTQRIKFTCFDVSTKLIVFGATSGGIYIYSIEPCHFIKLIPTKYYFRRVLQLL
ncbi:Hermansky-Pudlak syndrome 5 protein homolog isoform X2 [Agrilus planipennis]|uniref:Hermansky-Pudlak syndrome 5 protein homolog isoform X2 n=1 Tax=Agrilus planipennis TaxID=224129 RepID=A0A1W4XKR4_AGRPL|nr:Hermansky-Pudlak syndrome 5 protein homolog isoform X2 [Agrilus planipennis]